VAASKIKKKSSEKPSAMPTQGALPCLILLAVIFIVVGLFVFFGFKHMG
jgi:hypothetical protein